MEEHIGVLAGTAFVVVLSMIYYVLTQVIERGEPATARTKHHRVRRAFNNDLVLPQQCNLQQGEGCTE